MIVYRSFRSILVKLRHHIDDRASLSQIACSCSCT